MVLRGTSFKQYAKRSGICRSRARSGAGSRPLQQVQIPGLIYRNLNAQVLTANLVMISRMQEPGNAVTAFLAMANLPC